MYRKYKITLVIAFTGMLAVVGIQIVWPFIPEGSKLKGSVEPSPAPIWNPTTIRSGEAFRATEKWYNERVGIRNFWIRLDNQLTYHAFNEAPQNGGGTAIVVGKNDWLYERQYVRHSVTPAKPDDDQIQAAISQMRSMQDKLASRGIPFLLIIGPSKAEIYPERVPAAYLGGRDKEQITTYYEHYKPMLIAAGINFYDGPQVFLDWKQAGQRNLFSRGGTHWSYVAALQVLNEVRERLNREMRLQIPPFVVDRVTNGPAQFSDTDLLDLMNLLGEFEANHPQPFPILRKQTEVPETKLPKILWVHDSFGWPLIELLYNANNAKPAESVYYNTSIFKVPGGERTQIEPKEIDWEQFLSGYDAVIMVWTEIAFEYVGWGFPERVNQQLK